ncbi:MAG: serine hydrolase domain-containing protein, partial [Saprospiraceae bacterium]
EIDYKKTPGFVIGVLDQDSIWFFSFGSKKSKNNGLLLSESDVFEVGSVTKLLTSALISELIKEGKFQLDTPINDLLPKEFFNPRLDWVTVFHLINHQSGLPRRPLLFGQKEKEIQNPYGHYTKKDLLNFYKDYIPDQSGFEYSHTNYALLEVIVEQATNQTFNDALTEKILTPLHMRSSFIDFPERRINLITQGYDLATKPVQPWAFESFKASEGLKTTAADLLKFVKSQINSQIKPNFATGLDKNAETQSPSFNKYLSISNGWQLLNIHENNIYTHTGRTSGHHCFVAMIKETKTAVIIMANSALGAEDLGMQILRMINYNWKKGRT